MRMPFHPGQIPITIHTGTIMAITTLGDGASPCHGDGVIRITAMAGVIPGMDMVLTTVVMAGEVVIITVITMAGMMAIGMEVADITLVAEALIMAQPANQDTPMRLQ